MANIESKNLLVWVKSMSRGQSLPLDSSEIHESLFDAESYANSAIAYPGQTIKAKLEDGKYHEYILQPTSSGYELEEVGASQVANLKQYVVIVDQLPEYGQQQGVLYICGTTGSIWMGDAWKDVFWDVTPDIENMRQEILSESAQNATGLIESRLGSIPLDTTVRSYIDDTVNASIDANTTAVETAKQEAIDAAKLYADAKISASLSVVEF